ncbi:hypothetical protein BHK98_03865 [Hornefia porci]|uniref:Uncharacterized protein n=1 Tax=Hornefia porci TaxID=2652292 RepID=A0A1Q9JGA8_9FIRM|nr:hypothetical protein [Hornefia porci]OLR55276.1 hypothetical protein BHK98_03865 [Hornefia porci]
MDWSKGYSARYQLYRIDPKSWRDVEKIEIISGDIDLSSDGLLASMSLEAPELPTDREVWLRVYLDARQSGSEPERVALFTGLTGAPEVKYDHGSPTYSADLYSVLKPAQDVLLQRGWYAPAGLSGGIIARNLLKGYAPIEIAKDAPTLQSAIVAEDSETELSMAEKVVSAMGWRIRLTGAGQILIEPNPEKVAAIFDASTFDVIETSVSVSRDWLSAPNVMRATIDDTVAVARDDSGSSPLSVKNRGREVWQEADDVSLYGTESLSEYAVRALEEAQATAEKISYNRRFVPDVGVGDIVKINYPKQNIKGRYRITSQSITLGHAGKTAEEAVKIG